MNSSALSIEGGRAAETVVIEPRKGWRGLGLREVWRFRELLFFLTWRDVKVRYKQSLLGAAWAIIQPFTYMIVFTFVFGKLAQVPSDGIPYPLFAFSGLILWSFFSSAVVQSGNSIVSSSNILTKIYLPRLSIPFASVGAILMDLAISFTFLLVIMAYYYFFAAADTMPITIGWQMLLVIPIALCAVLAALGVGTILAALNVAFRDIKHTVPFLVQLWMFATPVIYMGAQPEQQVAASSRLDPIAQRQQSDSNARPSREGVVPDRVQDLFVLNPMVGLISSFRAAVLNQPIPWGPLGYSACASILIFLVGVLYFRRVEQTFADIV